MRKERKISCISSFEMREKPPQVTTLRETVAQRILNKGKGFNQRESQKSIMEREMSSNSEGPEN